jgi:hypothetical protein
VPFAGDPHLVLVEESSSGEDKEKEDMDCLDLGVRATPLYNTRSPHSTRDLCASCTHSLHLWTACAKDRGTGLMGQRAWPWGADTQ